MASNGDSPGTAGGEGQAPPSPTGLNWPRFSEIVQTRKVDVGLWATRLLTLIFAILYLAPFFGYLCQLYKIFTIIGRGIWTEKINSYLEHFIL